MGERAKERGAHRRAAGSGGRVNPSVADELDRVKDDLMVLESQTATVTNRITALEQRGIL